MEKLSVHPKKATHSEITDLFICRQLSLRSMILSRLGVLPLDMQNAIFYAVFVVLAAKGLFSVETLSCSESFYPVFIFVECSGVAEHK